MPVIKSAKKKLRKDKVREQRNSVLRVNLKQSLKNATKKPSVENIKKAIRAADKSVKNNIIHKNKAARIKSRLSKLIKPTAKKSTEKSVTSKNSSKAKK